MAKRECMYVQQLEHMKKFTNENNELLIEDFEKSLNERFPSDLYEWAYIIHDKDKSSENPNELVKPHIHFYIKRLGKKSLARRTIKEFFEEDNLSVVKDVSYGPSILCYLVHFRNNQGKHEYDVEEVHANFEYSFRMLEIWYSKKINKEFKSANDTSLEKLVLEGRLDKADIFSDNELSLEYARNANTINRAFDILEERKKMEVHAKKFGEYNDELMDFSSQFNGISEQEKRVIFMTGNSGVGKTALSKAIAKSLVVDKEEKSLNTSNIYITSDFNDPFEFYGRNRREQVIIFEEFRTKSYDTSELLRLFENNDGMLTVKSRYRNKILDPNVIIVNSIQSFLDLKEYFNVEKREDDFQIFRRFTFPLELMSSDFDENGNGFIEAKLVSFNKTPRLNIRCTVDDRYHMKRLCEPQKYIIFRMKNWNDLVGVEEMSWSDYESMIGTQKKSDAMENDQTKDDSDLPFL